MSFIRLTYDSVIIWALADLPTAPNFVVPSFLSFVWQERKMCFLNESLGTRRLSFGRVNVCSRWRKRGISFFCFVKSHSNYSLIHLLALIYPQPTWLPRRFFKYVSITLRKVFRCFHWRIWKFGPLSLEPVYLDLQSMWRIEPLLPKQSRDSSPGRKHKISTKGRA